MTRRFAQHLLVVPLGTRETIRRKRHTRHTMRLFLSRHRLKRSACGSLTATAGLRADHDARRRADPRCLSVVSTASLRAALPRQWQRRRQR